MTNPIIKKAYTSIGNAAAEDDEVFLFENFVRHDSYEVATDFDDPRFLLVGRTGAGKTAVLKHIEKYNERVINIEPKELSLKYISNSTIMQFLTALGVKLDLFYDLIWRHVIATELIKAHFGLDDQASTGNFLADLVGGLSSKRKKAIEYLTSFGDEFWTDVDARVTQVTKTFEQTLELTAGVKAEVVDAGLKSLSKLTNEEQSEIRRRSQKVISELKIQELGEVIGWLSEEVFTDPQKKWFLIVDELDTSFVSEEMRYPLIMALIETAKKFRRVKNVRFNIAIRADLLERTFRSNEDVGFQWEKYEGNLNVLTWDKSQLEELLDLRISSLYRRQYSKQTKVGLTDLFPEKVQGRPPKDYILSRTLMRPRDAIAFVNDCLARGVGKAALSAADVKKAENSYSDKRFRALEDEWKSDHPLLRLYVSVLRGQPSRFRLSDVSMDVFASVYTEIFDSNCWDEDRVAMAAYHAGDLGAGVSHQFVFALVSALYKIGIIDIKPRGAPEKLSVVDGSKQLLAVEDVRDDTLILVPPMLWQFLNVRPAKADR